VNLTMHKSVLPVLLLCGLVSACNSSNDDGEMMNGGEMTAATFAFATDAPDTYTRVDRSGMPAVSTALIASKDAYNLTPCTYVGDGTGTCAAAAVPLIIPDTLKINTAADAGFPNGRKLADPVIGVTLAVALLELTGETPPHTATDLVGVLNPAANDKELPAAFPFLAAPHQ